jgi:hypothetical protein
MLRFICLGHIQIVCHPDIVHEPQWTVHNELYFRFWLYDNCVKIQ